MMNFRTVNQAILDSLGASAGGQFRVVGFQGQGQDASEVRGSNRLVQSCYTRGEMTGRTRGTVQHDMTFNISLTCSAPARLNLSVINNELSTAPQIAAALAALQEAASVVDTAMDELFELVFQILMDANNYDIGLPVGTVANRWIHTVQKDEPIPQGSLVVLTGNIEFTCRTVEDVIGVTAVPLESISTVLDISGDDVEKTGVDVTL